MFPGLRMAIFDQMELTSDLGPRMPVWTAALLDVLRIEASSRERNGPRMVVFERFSVRTGEFGPGIVNFGNEGIDPTESALFAGIIDVHFVVFIQTFAIVSVGHPVSEMRPL
jgi:hypothetical protein